MTDGTTPEDLAGDDDRSLREFLDALGFPDGTDPAVALELLLNQRRIIAELQEDLTARVRALDEAEGRLEALRDQVFPESDDLNLSIAGSAVLVKKLFDGLERPEPALDPTAMLLKVLTAVEKPSKVGTPTSVVDLPEPSPPRTRSGTAVADWSDDEVLLRANTFDADGEPVLEVSARFVHERPAEPLSDDEVGDRVDAEFEDDGAEPETEPAELTDS